jgi:UDP-N-acetyl-alpha-D-muramoyl-L-alanyl-L-glutamate epimerase
MKIEVIKIDDLKIHEHHLDIIYSADKFKFSTKVFYHDVSFSTLIKKYSQQLIERIAAHIALFEGMKLCSLFPNYYDISIIAQHVEKPVIDLFIKIYQGVFAQHWYENNVTDYQHPEIIHSQALGESNPVPILGDNHTVLASCGGGKDSILAMKILQEADITFASMQYSHSVYGKTEVQHNLIAEVLSHVNPIKKHLISIYDDFIDFPFLKLYFCKNSGITAPETPVSIFESLFLILDGGYNYLCLAHEKSANTGNLFWEGIGREVNHQWGKGFEAEQILDQFIRDNLLSNFKYFSILQPIYDFRIFQIFSKYPELLPKFHSCNIKKPWCKKCPKCAYVWLGLMAFCEPNIVDAVFQSNLSDDADLLPTFREMVGLSNHTPFECIGEIEESRLMMKICIEKGLTGKALDMFVREVLADTSIDWQYLEQKYNSVYDKKHAIPHWLFEKLRDKL